MIKQPAFNVEPWRLRETALDLDLLAQTESVFALSNGHIGWRANLDEGEPHGLPGTYLNGVYESRPLPYAEAGYGLPESGQTVINVTNGKLIRLFVDDEPFDVRYGELRSHERVLDFRAGVLSRRAEWVSPAGGAVRVSSTRLVSFTQRAIAAICYEVEPLDGPVRIAVQSELLANEQLPGRDRRPRARPGLEPSAGAGVARAARAGRGPGAPDRAQRAARRRRHGPPDRRARRARGVPGLRRRRHGHARPRSWQPGQRLRVIKFVAYGWSGARSLPGVRDQVWAALTAARQTGWDGLLAEQRAFLDDFWDRADVEVDGDAEIQQAVRFALFHVLQAGARGENRPIPAKGLTGPGYDGHAFWDTETFVLPVLTLTAPDAAASALRWRHGTLPAGHGAGRAARAWRARPSRGGRSHGEECSGYWPAGTAAFHVNADIADAVIRYVDATGDEEFDRGAGMELLAQTARLWRSLGHHDAAGPVPHRRGHRPGRVQRHRRQQRLHQPDGAAEPAGGRDAPRSATRTGPASSASTPRSRPAGATPAEAMFIPYDEALGVHPQAEGFTRHQVWDFAGTPPDHYPLLLHYPYFDLYRKQVVKQADLVLAMHLCGDAFTAEQKARNFAYYEPLTVRDSSLSACTQAVIAAEVGHLALAFDYLGEAALMDLRDLEHNTRDGVHIASLAGAWIALVAGLRGPAVPGRHGRLRPPPARGPDPAGVHPPLPRKTPARRGHPAAARYQLADGDPLEITHHGAKLTLEVGKPQERPISPAPTLPRPTQPPGREPERREASGTSA